MYDKRRPKYEWGNDWCAKPVTEAQAAMIARLAEQAWLLVDMERLNRGTAAALIDDLKSRYSFTHWIFRRDWIDTKIVMPAAWLLAQEINFWQRLEGAPTVNSDTPAPQLLEMARKIGIGHICEPLLRSNSWQMMSVGPQETAPVTATLTDGSANGDA